MPDTGSYVFAEPQPTASPHGFFVRANDDQYYSQVDPKLVEDFPTTKGDGRMDLADVVGQNRIAQVQASGKILFHSGGDTGPAKVPYYHEAITDRMAEDFTGSPLDPAFFYHLGDVVYNFGEPELYYAQFFEPYRNYPAPIFAIPGNHDGVVFQGDPLETLQSFSQVFVDDEPRPSSLAGGLSRTTMNQPGVYFTLDAPFVSIICLYSNVLEGPGVISSEGGRYTKLDDRQVHFLAAELGRLRPHRNDPNDPLKAVILAVHHPPFSGDATKPGSESLVRDIDRASSAAGMAPDAVLSGHAHNYQRFIRTLDAGNGTKITAPYIIAGSAGHNAQLIKRGRGYYDPGPDLPITAGDHTWTSFKNAYAYLMVEVDSVSNQLKIDLRAVDQRFPTYTETTTIDLAQRQVLPDATWQP